MKEWKYFSASLVASSFLLDAKDDDAFALLLVFVSVGEEMISFHEDRVSHSSDVNALWEDAILIPDDSIALPWALISETLDAISEP